MSGHYTLYKVLCRNRLANLNNTDLAGFSRFAADEEMDDFSNSAIWLCTLWGRDEQFTIVRVCVSANARDAHNPLVERVGWLERESRRKQPQVVDLCRRRCQRSLQVRVLGEVEHGFAIAESAIRFQNIKQIVTIDRFGCCPLQRKAVGVVTAVFPDQLIHKLAKPGDTGAIKDKRHALLSASTSHISSSGSCLRLATAASYRAAFVAWRRFWLRRSTRCIRVGGWG